MKYIKWNYYLDVYRKILCRIGLKESAHLMWQFGGVPMFNAELVDKTPSDWIGAKTDKRRFIMDRKLFDENKKEYDNKGEKQYYCDLFFWNIQDLSEDIS